MAAKKKTAKKKTTKKKAGKGKKKVVKRAPIVIIIFNKPDASGNPHYYVDERVKKASVGAGDVIRWFNTTAHAFTLTFDGGPADWPFQGAKRDIPVAPFEYSGRYKVVRKGKFSYHGDVLFENPPADPVIDAGD